MTECISLSIPVWTLGSIGGLTAEWKNVPVVFIFSAYISHKMWSTM